MRVSGRAGVDLFPNHYIKFLPFPTRFATTKPQNNTHQAGPRDWPAPKASIRPTALCRVPSAQSLTASITIL
ncbi:hypothetical protein VTJ04DRAFT_533 [Mycothermus thermophilus]|uniref:uncharacterized protein n=1 Tax=Humicola insolens TaxID=85995 RepID=UPI003741F12F